jgi:hypothetical protein
VARVREFLATEDSAVPTMEISLILDVSAQLASRVLLRLERCPEISDFGELLTAISRPERELEDVIVHARGWDDAVLQVEQQGRVSPAEARKVVDWVVLHMALEDWLESAGHDRALAEFAAVAGVSPEAAKGAGAAATLRMIAKNSETDRAAVTRAFVVAAQLDFTDAYRIADALGTEGSEEPVIAAAEWADKGDPAESAAGLVRDLGVTPEVGASVADALVRGFGKG